MRQCEIAEWTVFFVNDAATTEIYALSLHDALPISALAAHEADGRCARGPSIRSAVDLLDDGVAAGVGLGAGRSEEPRSACQSRQYFVFRLASGKKYRCIYTRGRHFHSSHSTGRGSI